MSISPSKEPRPLTPKVWENAWERAQRQRLLQQRKERAEQLAEMNRDKRFTHEQENVLKQLHERRTKDSHFMVVQVLDNRNEITLEDIEMLEKMIEIEEGETKEVVTGVKQTLVEPDVADAARMETEDPPLPIEQPVKMAEEKEIEVMEPQEKEVVEEKKQEKMEYGYTANVLIKDIFTSDNESKWDRINVKEEQIRFVFESIKTEKGVLIPRELRIIVHNYPRLKKKKEDDKWIVERVFQDVSYEIIKIIGEQRTTLQCDDKWFMEQIHEKENSTGEINMTRVTGSEQRLWVTNYFKRDGITVDVSSTVDISSTMFAVELTDKEEYILRRKAMEGSLAKSRYLNSLAEEIIHDYGTIERRANILRTQMQQCSTLIISVLGALLNADPITLSLDSYTREYLATLFDTLPEAVKNAAMEKVNEYYTLLQEYQTITEEHFSSWLDNGEQQVGKYELQLENLDRTLQGKKQRIPLTPFKLTVISDPEIEVEEPKQEVSRNLHITFHFQSIEQQREIEELFELPLQYVVFRIEEHTQKNRDYLQKKFDDDKRSYEEWKAKQAQEE